jgi:hypothetical protein
MDYIHLLNECPVTYVYSTWYREWCWEVYTPWGEILTLSDQHTAYEVRRMAVNQWRENRNADLTF